MKLRKWAVLGAAGVVFYGVHHAATPAAPAYAGHLASGALTSGQRTFGARLAADTGLNPGVITAWLLAEESSNYAAGRQAEGNNDWLNIGYTGSATYGAGDGIWGSPVTAADATAGWMKGGDTIPGYGRAAAGVRAIVGTAGESPSAQIGAIQRSGWAGSGYPSLSTLYGEAA